MTALLAGQVVATLALTGLVWFVQVVHYPLFPDAGRTGFADYERRHTALTALVVGPPMLAEAATGVLLLWFRPPGAAAWQLWAGLALIAVVWLSTARLQVPCHEGLCQGFDPDIHRRLVRTNWVRTAAWTLRSALALALTWSALGPG